jgi:hypothetical protein
MTRKRWHLLMESTAKAKNPTAALQTPASNLWSLAASRVWMCGGGGK